MFRDYAGIAQKYYGCTPYVIDLRNPIRSHGFNLLHLVNKYIDLYKKTGSLSDKARAERYTSITSKTIVRASCRARWLAGGNSPAESSLHSVTSNTSRTNVRITAVRLVILYDIQVSLTRFYSILTNK